MRFQLPFVRIWFRIASLAVAGLFSAGLNAAHGQTNVLTDGTLQMADLGRCVLESGAVIENCHIGPALKNAPSQVCHLKCSERAGPLSRIAISAIAPLAAS